MINHNQAIELEQIVRKLYKCDRGGVSRLVNADIFESSPIDAAKLVISYIYAKDLNETDDQYASFIDQYAVKFAVADEIVDAEQYIDELLEIVNRYCK
ncbi:hypothetical protein SAMN05216351_10367 [Pseudobutyrivibrio sp. JW11]|uniref:hypothetical protein n=1 Tax=Pseudobutyrivibrio sp. JW11 TaxID=1855302 RepID=UPI0008E63DC0|nr:hypothetical protein [Pseudobutyrivibrio sp. JW11]SFO08374.1 hypothetical protein SAMN05216351_10367 [Pseudobutyrivibrio sp. JW11]